MQTAFDFILRNWILIVILGNFLVAASNIISKVILSGSVAKPLPPASYAFVTGVWGLAAFPLAIVINIWTGFLRFDLWEGSFGVLAGMFFVLSLWLFYSVLEKSEASRVLTALVGAIPLFTFLLKFGVLGERLGVLQIFGFGFLVASGVLVSLKKSNDHKFTYKALFLVALAGFGFSMGGVMTEAVFQLQGFLSGLVWVALGYGLGALTPLILRSTRQQIFSVPKSAEKRNILMFFLDKALSFSGALLVKFAITLQSVTLVNAFEGIKQFFVLGLAALLSFKYPQILKEELRGVILWKKILAAGFVAAGIFLLMSGK
ncbi:hypothetical protein A2608_02530 [Candidatus Azambacteria bacterium RIFOXYD1_FULL_44_10]|nr:MAG: hypothetical protein A3C78_00095 [Candidatus Azambacteria bacterium RIFCSPHIGHO2_02_FULL_45_18]OGD52377.1 MAG: hypothetical protein A2608_02530 [Candidatus Azambacteria bacterium RIFOXYD1_FULL_44_10]